MRSKQEGEHLVVKAIAGTDVVVLARDFAPAKFKKMVLRAEDSNLLGFAVERSCFDKNGDLTEKGWLRGIKRFEKKDGGTAPGTLMPTSEHPIQSFQWADYTVDPGQRYAYRVVPTYGKPKLMELDEEAGVEVQVQTEPRAAPGNGIRHDVFFNRGVIGSQAYARRFDNAEPDERDPHSEEMKWLSRGLFEALIEFIEKQTALNTDYEPRSTSFTTRTLLEHFAQRSRILPTSRSSMTRKARIRWTTTTPSTLPASVSSSSRARCPKASATTSSSSC